MHRHFEDEMKRIREDLLYMASLAENAFASAITALQKRDQKMARRVIEQDTVLNQLEAKIHNECIELLARYQVVAGDLRFIASTLKSPTIWNASVTMRLISPRRLWR